MKIRLLSAGDAEKEFHYSDSFNKWHVYSDAKKTKFFHYSYVCIEVQASSSGEAHQIGFEAFELYRGIINFADDYQTTGKTRYGGIPEPTTLSVMEPAQVQMIFDSEKKHLSDGFTIGFFDYKTKEFTKRERSSRMTLLLGIINAINSLEKNQLRDRCITAFIKYNNGMDGNVSGTSFLEFWKILELVAVADLEEQGMAEYKVANRIAWLFKREENYVRDLLFYLCDRRNFITHKGQLPDVDDDELIAIKRFAEEAILFLLRYVTLFKDDATLSTYFDMLSKNETELDRLELAIKEANRYLGFKQEKQKTDQQETTT